MLETRSPASLRPEGQTVPQSPPAGLPAHARPPLLGKRPPRCPPFVEVTNSDQLMPYLEHVARRPYNHGLNACWDLKEGERVLHAECYVGSVFRNFTLPSELDEAASKAKYENGVLELTLAKKAQVAGRKLTIQ